MDIKNINGPGSPCSTTSDSNYFDDIEDIDAFLCMFDDVELKEQPHSSTEVVNSDFKGKRKASNNLDGKPSKIPRILQEKVSAALEKLAPIVIADLHHSRDIMEDLPYGVQWEIARLATKGFEKQIFTPAALERLRDLRSNAAAAPQVEDIARGRTIRATQDDPYASAYAMERAAKLPWDELDTEEQVFKQDPFGGLGCNDDKPYLQDKPDWYGGKVHFIATLHLDGKDQQLGPRFTFSLDPPRLGSSCRFTRRFGSYQFIRVNIPQEIYTKLQNLRCTEDELVDFFTRPIVIHSWVFRAVTAKEGTVFLFRTSERWDGREIVTNGSRSDSVRELSLPQFLSWHNDPSANQEQTMVKWAARFALGLSNSVPGIRLDPNEVGTEDDIVCPGFSGAGKVPNEMIMTDGCGLVTSNVLISVQKRLGWPSEPTAVQMRLGGAKGLLLLDAKSSVPSVVLRPSQIKIHGPVAHDSAPDPALLIIDVLKPGRLSTPARLSTETIINMAENGVPSHVFIQLMQNSVRQLVRGLTMWTDPSSVYELWRNIASAGGVISARLARESPGSSRAKGYRNLDKSSPEITDNDADDFDEASQDHSTPWWGDPVSGCPSSLEETTLVLLDAGFTPDKCRILAEKLREVTKKAVDAYVNKFHISVPMSCTAFVVPDPCGVLEPGQVHIKSSYRNLTDRSGRPTEIVLGEVLLTRHPCKVPTDVQKAVAVMHPQLFSYVDVIVVSTKGHLFNNETLHCHLASMTGGGDYDGDLMEAFWDPSLVSAFSNAPPAFAQEPEAIQKCIVKNTETVDQFLARTSASGPASVLYELQKHLLAPLKGISRVGIYSTMWEASIYKYGYKHPHTLFLAYMFTTVLDGVKTGISVSNGVFEEHQKVYSCASLPWKDSIVTRAIFANSGHAKRNMGLPPFVMDELHAAVHREYEKQKEYIFTLFPRKGFGPSPEFDHDLARPWNDARELARQAKEGKADGWQRKQKELDAIKAHVEAPAASQKGKAKETEVTFTGLPIDKRQDILRDFSIRFDQGPTSTADGQPIFDFDKETIRRLRASYAYIYDYNRSSDHWSQFPFNVAMRTLCEIKAKAHGPSKTVTEDFYIRMKVGRAYARK
ncbi:uncharacterized protein LAESUDRAFT_680055 [Laetiporus sulphureus 93-53]|uniref:RNA-dependent RNA polymerase n=1 Tax=Laetiporus sulphureus 93-53 TaxID=1314785 RepID=A0A165E0Z9_9APHY|nr:uncharacterized protein LAESUDRAFT_680055 [Laetiporus sulphureus 93-53]KZT06039.1 hypothetical protein LAESUDRAFT_680055 [Laetiporus sulphureus 93-53]